MDEHGLKASLRKQIRAALERIPPAKRAADSQALCERLKIQMQSAQTILFFAPLPSEIDIWPLLAESLPSGKMIALPCFDSASQSYVARRVQNLPNEILVGKFGVREPAENCSEISSSKLDLVLVPGVAFDLSGHRLGRGGGFYDRLLAGTGGVKCGIAFDEQIVETIPSESHDAKMNFILTPTRCVKASA